MFTIKKNDKLLNLMISIIIYVYHGIPFRFVIYVNRVNVTFTASMDNTTLYKFGEISNDVQNNYG